MNNLTIQIYGLTDEQKRCIQNNIANNPGNISLCGIVECKQGGCDACPMDNVIADFKVINYPCRDKYGKYTKQNN